MIRYIIFRAFEMIGILMFLPLIVAFYFKEWECAVIFMALAGTVTLLGVFGARKKPKSYTFFAREGFVITALIWIVISLIGALPFVITGEIPHYVDAVFETVSGFTTTGASIMRTLTGMSKSTLFWRSFTHWLGGMGVLVFMLAVLPLSGGSGSTMHLMRAESPGPSVGKFVPKVKSTAKLLYMIYVGFTLTEILLLVITGLDLFEASTLTFGTVGTGGFAITDASINPYPLSSQIIIMIFMMLCGVNFSVYYLLSTRRFKEALKSEEVRWYLIILFGSAALITINLVTSGVMATTPDAIHHSLFTVTSIITTTGYATADFNVWPAFSKSIIFLLTLLGACAGSTGGGFKVSRLIIIIKRIRNELIFNTHRKSVKQVYLDRQRVDGTTVKSVVVYVCIYALLYLFSFVLISLDGFSFETNFTAVAATINNVGPGFEMVGATGNYANFSAFSKIVLSVDMLAGRLEFIPILLLLRRKTWLGD